MKKIRKILSLIVVGVMLCGTMAACSASPQPTTAPATTSNASSDTQAAAPTTAPTPEPKAEDELSVLLAEAGLDENLRFTETRKITVEIYDRGNEGGSKPEDNYYTDFIKKEMLEKHNVEVSFVPVPRWTEGDEINNLLAAGTAPDVCVTYSYPTIQTYAKMGGIIDMAPYVNEYKDILPDLWGLLKENNIYYDRDPEKGTIWAIEALLFNNRRTNTFVREDWLNKLGLTTPTTLEEFEAMLYAFKDNAELLLGADANKLIPYSTSYDIGWRNDHLVFSYVPDALTDKEAYVNGFDDRRFLFPNYKEGIRKLNEWYNAGLMWKDFPLYGEGDTTEDNLIKSGYVGAFHHNWDYPYRGGEEGIHSMLQRVAGEDAVYVAVEPFKNDAGNYRKLLSSPVDRKLFFPVTNKEPVASILYLNWLSTLENRRYLQIGDEGVTHEVMEDGAVKAIASSGNTIMNSGNNIDYTIVINGLDLGDNDLNIKSLALGYAGVDSRLIDIAAKINTNDIRIGKAVNVGEITAEEGMGPALKEKRDVTLINAVIASQDQFDSVFDSGMQDYLNSGGQAIRDEREAKWQQYFGSSTMLP